MINKSHIKKAIFVYKTSGTVPLPQHHIRTFDGVTHAQKELNINHEIIKKHALLSTSYKGYFFTYERLID